MLKRPVIAADITNLTDARYFASWGVDYLMYNLNHADINKIQEISEWIDGVRNLVFFDHKNIGFLEEVMIKLKPYAVGAADNKVLGKLLSHIKEDFIFYYYTDSETSHLDLTSPDNINHNTYKVIDKKHALTFWDFEGTHARLSSFLTRNESKGVIIRGSSEIETGLKSYENVDILLELLEKSD